MTDGSNLSVPSQSFCTVLEGIWGFPGAIWGGRLPQVEQTSRNHAFFQCFPFLFFFFACSSGAVSDFFSAPTPLSLVLCNSSRFLKSAAVSCICVCPAWQIPGPKPLSCCLPVLCLSVRQEGACRQHGNVMRLDVIVLKQGLKKVEGLRGFHLRTKVTGDAGFTLSWLLKTVFYLDQGLEAGGSSFQ